MLSSDQEVLKREDAEFDGHVVMVPSADLSTLTIVEPYAITIKSMVSSSSRNAVNLYTKSRYKSRMNHIVGVRNEGNVDVGWQYQSFFCPQEPPRELNRKVLTPELVFFNAPIQASSIKL